MKIVEISTTDSEQTQRLTLDGVLCAIRVYWSENSKCMAVANGEIGQWYMEISSDLFVVHNIAITLGNEIFFPYGQALFGGFLATDNTLGYVNPTHGSDWSLLYIPLDKVEDAREFFNAV